MRPENMDLRYASCNLHGAYGQDIRIRDRFMRGTVFVEQEYFGDQWTEPNSWMVVQRLRDGQGVDPLYDVTTIENQYFDPSKCAVKTIANRPAPTESTLVSGFRATKGTLAASKSDAQTAANTFLIDGTTDYGSKRNEIWNQSIIIRLQEMSLTAPIYENDEKPIVGCCKLM